MEQSEADVSRGSMLNEETLQSAAFAFWGLAAAGFLLLCASVWGYATYGHVLLDYLETAEPEVVFDRGRAFERALQTDKAVDAYRRALALGFTKWSPEYECKKRLEALLVERGRLKGVTINREANLLENGSFEDKLQRWLDGSAATEGLVLDAVERVQGNAGLRVDLSKGAQQVLRNRFAVIPGGRYRLSGWMRTVDAQPGVVLGVEGDDGSFFASGTAFTGTQDWKQWAFEFAVPDALTEAAVVLRGTTVSTGGLKGTVWVDDCLLDPGPNSLLRNTSFELGDSSMRHWLGSLAEGVKATADTVSPREGLRALRLDSSAPVDVTMWQSASVTQDVPCRLTGWIRTKDLVGGQARLEVRDADRGWQAFSQQTDWVSGSTDWAPQTLTFTPSAETKRVLVSLRVKAAQGASEAHGSVWFDAVTLIQPAPEQ